MTLVVRLLSSVTKIAACPSALDGGFAFTDVGADVLPEEMQGKGVDSAGAW